MKFFILAWIMGGCFLSQAADKKEERTPAQTSRNQVLFDRVEISSGKDADGNIVTRIIDRDQKVVCFTYRRPKHGRCVDVMPSAIKLKPLVSGYTLAQKCSAI